MADENNEFEDIVQDNEEAPLAEFAETTPGKSEEVEVMPGDIGGATFIKAPEVGEEVILDVEKVVNNPNITGKNKSTGETFTIGLQKKDKTVIRYDIVTPEGRFTVMNWEIFFKLFGADGILTKYGKEHNSFNGCKIRIRKDYNARYINMTDNDVSKILNKTIEEAQAHKKEIADAMKQKKLYTVELIPTK